MILTSAAYLPDRERLAQVLSISCAHTLRHTYTQNYVEMLAGREPGILKASGDAEVSPPALQTNSSIYPLSHEDRPCIWFPLTQCQKGGVHQATTDFGKTGKAQETQYPVCRAVLGTVSSGETQQGPCAPHEVWKVRVSSVSHPNTDENPSLCQVLAESVWFSVGSSRPLETLSQSSQESHGTTWFQLFSGRCGGPALLLRECIKVVPTTQLCFLCPR